MNTTSRTYPATPFQAQEHQRLVEAFLASSPEVQANAEALLARAHQRWPELERINIFDPALLTEPVCAHLALYLRRGFLAFFVAHHQRYMAEVGPQIAAGERLVEDLERHLARAERMHPTAEVVRNVREARGHVRTARRALDAILAGRDRARAALSQMEAALAATEPPPSPSQAH